AANARGCDSATGAPRSESGGGDPAGPGPARPPVSRGCRPGDRVRGPGSGGDRRSHPGRAAPGVRVLGARLPPDSAPEGAGFARSGFLGSQLRMGGSFRHRAWRASWSLALVAILATGCRANRIDDRSAMREEVAGAETPFDVLVWRAGRASVPWLS